MNSPQFSLNSLLAGSRKQQLMSLAPHFQGVKRELQEACETARNRGQDAHVAQLAAETKASILEGRVNECAQMVRML